MNTSDLFSTRETVDEAVAYATSLIESLPADSRAAAMTAMWVPLNTALKQMESLKLENIPRKALPDGLTIADVTWEMAAAGVPDAIFATMANAFSLSHLDDEKLQFLGNQIASFAMLVARVYNIPLDELRAETRKRYEHARAEAMIEALRDMLGGLRPPSEH